jgi:hypothetical protein
MDIDIRLNETIGWSILAIGLVIIILTLAFNHHDYMVKKVAEDNKTQRILAEQGYTPLEISCAYNIVAPACVLLAGGK